MSTQTDAFLAALDGTKPKLSFAEFLKLIHAQRYTGPITFHVFSGVPTSAELPRDPVQIRLDSHLPLDSGT